MMLYLSGPMSGIPEQNRPLFHAKAAELRAVGYQVINPAELPRGWTWCKYMRRGIADMMKAEGIAVLPGFLDSNGAMFELRTANYLDFALASVDDWIRLAKEGKELPPWIRG